MQHKKNSGLSYGAELHKKVEIEERPKEKIKNLKDFSEKLKSKSKELKILFSNFETLLKQKHSEEDLFEIFFSDLGRRMQESITATREVKEARQGSKDCNCSLLDISKFATELFVYSELLKKITPIFFLFFHKLERSKSTNYKQKVPNFHKIYEKLKEVEKIFKLNLDKKSYEIFYEKRLLEGLRQLSQAPETKKGNSEEIAEKLSVVMKTGLSLKTEVEIFLISFETRKKLVKQSREELAQVEDSSYEKIMEILGVGIAPPEEEIDLGLNLSEDGEIGEEIGKTKRKSQKILDPKSELYSLAEKIKKGENSVEGNLGELEKVRFEVRGKLIKLNSEERVKAVNSLDYQGPLKEASQVLYKKVNEELAVESFFEELLVEEKIKDVVVPYFLEEELRKLLEEKKVEIEEESEKVGLKVFLEKYSKLNPSQAKDLRERIFIMAKYNDFYKKLAVQASERKEEKINREEVECELFDHKKQLVLARKKKKLKKKIEEIEKKIKSYKGARSQVEKGATGLFEKLKESIKKENIEISKEVIEEIKKAKGSDKNTLIKTKFATELGVVISKLEGEKIETEELLAETEEEINQELKLDQSELILGFLEEKISELLVKLESEEFGSQDLLDLKKEKDFYLGKEDLWGFETGKLSEKLDSFFETIGEVYTSLVESGFAQNSAFAEEEKKSGERLNEKNISAFDLEKIIKKDKVFYQEKKRKELIILVLKYLIEVIKNLLIEKKWERKGIEIEEEKNLENFKKIILSSAFLEEKVQEAFLAALSVAAPNKVREKVLEFQAESWETLNKKIELFRKSSIQNLIYLVKRYKESSNSTILLDKVKKVSISKEDFLRIVFKILYEKVENGECSKERLRSVIEIQGKDESKMSDYEILFFESFYKKVEIIPISHELIELIKKEINKEELKDSRLAQILKERIETTFFQENKKIPKVKIRKDLSAYKKQGFVDGLNIGEGNWEEFEKLLRE